SVSCRPGCCGRFAVPTSAACRRSSTGSPWFTPFRRAGSSARQPTLRGATKRRRSTPPPDRAVGRRKGPIASNDLQGKVGALAPGDPEPARKGPGGELALRLGEPQGTGRARVEPPRPG